jgi:hypothetical protein
MTDRFALYGTNSRQMLTYNGLIITHHNRAQLEWMHPGTRVVDVPGDIPESQCLPIRFHPDYAAVQWDANGDLDRRQFRDAS